MAESSEQITPNEIEIAEVGYIKDQSGVDMFDFAFDHKEITKRYLASKER